MKQTVLRNIHKCVQECLSRDQSHDQKKFVKIYLLIHREQCGLNSFLCIREGEHFQVALCYLFQSIPLRYLKLSPNRGSWFLSANIPNEIFPEHKTHLRKCKNLLFQELLFGLHRSEHKNSHFFYRESFL